MNRTFQLLLAASLVGRSPAVPALAGAIGVAGLLRPPVAVAAEPGAFDHLRALAGAAPTAPALPKGKDPTFIPWQDAASHVGELVEVEGVIVHSYANDKVCFLNFDKDFANSLTLVIFASAYPSFPAGPQFYYQEKRVRAIGVVLRSDRGTLQLILAHPDQIIVASAQASDVLYWEDVTPAHANQVVTVEGVVHAVNVSPKVANINFHPNWTRYVTGSIFATTFARFPADLKAAYEGKPIRMTGRVQLYEGRPSIVLYSSAQVQVQGSPARTQRLTLDKDRIVRDDGDTIRYAFSAEEGVNGQDGKPYSGGLRLLGFDTPETMHPEDGIFYSQPKGNDAKRLTNSLLAKAKKVQFLTRGEFDKYGRVLGHLIVDGELLSVALIRAGLAYEAVTPYGDNGFPSEAKQILKAWAKSPIAIDLEAGKKPPFLKPYEWRKLNQVHELAVPKDEWAAMTPAKRKAVLAKVKEIVEGRRGGEGLE